MPKKNNGFFRQLDPFGDSVTFNIKGNAKLGTTLGMFFGMVTYFLIFIYGFTKFMTMWNYEDTL